MCDLIKGEFLFGYSSDLLEESCWHLDDSSLVHMRDKQFETFLEKSVLSLGLVFFFFHEHFQTEVDSFQLVLLLAAQDHHVQSGVEHHDFLFCLRLLIVKVLICEVFVDTKELLDVLPCTHV